MAIRTGVDYMRTAYFDSSLAIKGQNNIRTTAAVVYYFGVADMAVRTTCVNRPQI